MGLIYQILFHWPIFLEFSISANVFTDWMPHLSPNQSTEGKYKVLVKITSVAINQTADGDMFYWLWFTVLTSVILLLSLNPKKL